LKISNTIPESFRLFVPHEKSEAFWGKDNPDDLTGAISQGIENYLSWQLVAGVNSNFLSPCKATDGIYGHFHRAVVGFSYFKSLLMFREKGNFDGTSKKFGLSLNFAKAHENDSQLVVIMAVLRVFRNFDNRLTTLETPVKSNNPIAYNLKQLKYHESN
jgi:hypothetical protein